MNAKEKKEYRTKKLIEQGNNCAWCNRPDYCAACENDLPHKGNRGCVYQKVDTFDHNHECCSEGCNKCFRGTVHRMCNRIIGFIQNTEHLQNDFIKEYINKGKPIPPKV